MATIKSYTDIEQSKKLAEILPRESADMSYAILDFVDEDTEEIVSIEKISLGQPSEDDIPCWSLAALLGVLPMIIKNKENANPFIAKTPNNEYYIVYATFTKEVDSSAIYDNPIDACYDMILKLHELNLL